MNNTSIQNRTERYLRYTRSGNGVAAGLVMVWVAFLLATEYWIFTQPVPVLLVVASLVMVGLLTWATELHPKYNLHPRPNADLAVRAVVIMQVIYLAVGIPLILMHQDNGWFTLGGILIFYATGAAGIMPWPLTKWIWPVAIGASAVTVWTMGTVFGLPFIGLIPLVWAAMVVFSMWPVNLLRELDEAREAEAQLKVTEERLRFAQELHDTLGQHLAAMSVKAELTKALVNRGDERATQQLQELQELTKVSLAEMRQVVQGYRQVNLATEVAGTRTLLADSGIALTVIGDVFAVPERARPLVGWFVREATTNVLKHSDATEVKLTLSSQAVTMTNNGATDLPGPRSGLAGLTKRAEADGGALLVDRVGDTFTVTLQIGAA